ncbi:MAG: NfeD family protein [Heliobacteriaceae bacterium]|jgi:membrane protein implicated in regulation of membrane protease activity|nr:NfeD family protein [Heliobacteriaceae bacterium]
MILWEFFAIAGIVFLILEMAVPSIFFLNLALAGFLTAVISLLISDFTALIVIFVALSLLSIFILRPILIKNKTKTEKTGLEAKYIGHSAKVINTVTGTSGAISIYDERWEARTENNEEIPSGCGVKILRNDSLVMYVTKEI